MMQEGQDEPIFNEFQMRYGLVKVRSKLNEKRVFSPIYRNKITLSYVEGKPVVKVEKILEAYEEKKYKTNYREPLNEDLSTAFLTNDEKTLCLQLIILMESTKNFADKRELDMSALYNFYGGLHDYIVVSSKATGDGARISSQQQTVQKYQVMESKLGQQEEEQAQQQPAQRGKFDFKNWQKRHYRQRNFDSLI